MDYTSSSKALPTEYGSTQESESGWTNYIGDGIDDGAESEDSVTSDARSSSPPPSRQFHRYNLHYDDQQDKLRVQIASSVSKKMQLLRKQMDNEKSMKQPCNYVTNTNKQANHATDREEEKEEEDDDGHEQLRKYQQAYRTTDCSTTDAFNYGFYRAQNP